jgi:hypothetical protein
LKLLQTDYEKAIFKGATPSIYQENQYSPIGSSPDDEGNIQLVQGKKINLTTHSTILTREELIKKSGIDVNLF